MKKLLTLITIAAILLGSSQSFAAEIKVAIVAPEGSTWSNVVKEWNEELKAKTNGQLSFKIYAGGVQGDERDVVRKMKIGQLEEMLRAKEDKIGADERYLEGLHKESDDERSEMKLRLQTIELLS